MKVIFGGMIGTSIKHNSELQKRNMVGLMLIMYYDSAIKLENTFYCIWLFPKSKDILMDYKK